MSGRGLTFATAESYLRRTDDRRSQNQRGVLIVRLGGELYGIEILSIHEIIRPREITEVPRAASCVLGVVTVRGVVIPVVDLGRRLRLASTPLGPAARILVVMHEGERFGLLVERVIGVVRLADGQTEAPPASLMGGEVPFLAGIARYYEEEKERMVVLLSLGTVLSFEADKA